MGNPFSNQTLQAGPDEDPVRLAFFSSGRAAPVLARRTAEVDEAVKAAYAAHLAPSYPKGMAVLAVGGYGRGELFPHSDVDVLLLETEAPDAEKREAISRFLQTIWDAGLRLSHSVRSVRDCLEVHDQNIELNISLLDLRLLAGDEELFAGLDGKMPKFLSAQRQTLTRHLCKMTRQRHANFHNTIYHLEPNIKEMPGGLRDLHVLRWLKKLRGEAAAADSPWVNPVDGPAEFLFGVRCFLHYRSRRDNNLLSFDSQEECAEFVHAPDAAQWMREYFFNVRAIHRETLRTLEASEGEGSSLLAGFRDWRSRLSNADFTVSRDRILLKAPHSLPKDPELALRLFQFIGRHGVTLHRESEKRLQEHLPSLADYFASDRPLWPAIQDLFASKHCSLALRAMHETGILSLLFPRWSDIECNVIRDFNHRYTVDEHTLVTIQNIEELRDSEDPDRRRFTNLLSELPEVVTLRLALLFHDIGKADDSEESHCLSSARIAGESLRRTHAPENVTENVRFLIEHHLDLSAAMTSRDLDDPATAHFLAHRVETIERLKALTLLTYGDVGAVHPTALSPWRLEQLWRVYTTTYRELTRELDTERIVSETAGSPEQEAFLKGFPTRYLRTHTQDQVRTHLHMDDLRKHAGVAVDIRRQGGVYELSLLTKDRLFLFSSIAGTLASFGLNILKAEAFANQQGTVLDTFTFADPQRTLELNPPEMDRLRATIERVLLGKVTVRELLRNRPKPAPPSKGSRIQPRLSFDSNASETSTLVEVVTEDRPGLLYDLSSAISDAGCSIDVVLVDTEAHKAMDVFYITQNGRKVPEETAANLREKLLRACSS